MNPRNVWIDEFGDAVQDHIPSVRDRWVSTGLLGPSGRPLLRQLARPIGFRADLDRPPKYAEDEDSDPQYVRDDEDEESAEE